MAAPRGVWIDCDPGHDDALMLILAGYSDAISVLGVSTVAGNVPLEATTLNARRILWAAGLKHLACRVVPGAAAPLIRPPRCCPEVHGESGLAGYDWPTELPAEVRLRETGAQGSSTHTHTRSHTETHVYACIHAYTHPPGDTVGGQSGVADA